MSVSCERHWFERTANDVAVQRGFQFLAGAEVVALHNQQLPQSALGSRTPLQAMKDRHKLKPDLFKKQPYHLPGCDR